MIQLRNVHIFFHRGEGHQVQALRGITLDIAEGEFVTVIGTNGAGKSTLLNAISGVYQPDEGSISIAGRDVTGWSEHRRAALIGRVFQNPLDGTAGSLTIEQNMALALRRGQRRGFGRGVTRERRAEFRSALARLGMGLEDRLQSPVRLLSGGQRQALTLLMATLRRPEVLLLDEHTAALDPGAAMQVERLTRELIADQHLTALMVTHNMQQALSLGTRTLMLHAGEIILDLRSPERDSLSVQDLIAYFARTREDVLADDNLMLAY